MVTLFSSLCCTWAGLMSTVSFTHSQAQITYHTWSYHTLKGKTTFLRTADSCPPVHSHRRALSTSFLPCKRSHFCPLVYLPPLINQKKPRAALLSAVSFQPILVLPLPSLFQIKRSICFPKFMKTPTWMFALILVYLQLHFEKKCSVFGVDSSNPWTIYFTLFSNSFHKLLCSFWGSKSLSQDFLLVINDVFLKLYVLFLACL